MWRYLRLYAHFVRFSVSRAFEFRFDFFFRIVMDCIYYAVNIAFFKLIFLHTSNIGGWNEAQAMALVATYLLIDGITMTVFSNNMWWLPTYINRGDLDYFIIRPVSSLFFATTRDFAANSFINLVIAIGIAFWIFGSSPFTFSAVQIFFYCVAILAGSLIATAMQVFFLLPVFVTHSAAGLRQLYFTSTRLAERPDTIYGGVVRKLFMTFLPYCVVASLPTRILVFPFDMSVVLYILGVTALTLVILGLSWRWALKHYSSASS